MTRLVEQFRRLAGAVLGLTAVWLVNPGGLAGQVPAPPTAAPQALPVYVVNFTQSRPIHEIEDLGDFTTGLVQLRLLEIPALTVRRVDAKPACGGAPQAANRPETPAQNLAVQMAPPPSEGEAAAPMGGFYVVRGALDVQLPDIVLDYYVEKCEGHGYRPVFQDTQPFTVDHALEELTIAAHAIAFKLKRSVPATPLAVEELTITGSASEPSVPEDIRRQMVEALATSSDLRIVESGAAASYRVGGRLRLEKQGSRLRALTKWDTITAEVHIQAGDNQYPLPAITTPREQLPKLGGQIADEVRRSLPVVILAEERGWPELRGHMEAAELVSRGRQLLETCPKDIVPCRSAGDAIPVLKAATLKDPASEEAFGLLGQAEILTDNSADAVKSLERVRELVRRDHDQGRSVPPEKEVEYSNELGDAYRILEKYPEAEKSYDDSLRVNPAQSGVYARKAIALRYEGKRVEALETLLEGLQAGGSAGSQPLHDSAKEIIRALQFDEFAPAKTAVEGAAAKGLPVTDEYALLISRQEGQILDTKWNAENARRAQKPLEQALSLKPSDPDVQAEIYANLGRTHLFDSDLQTLDALLKEAEKLPAYRVSASNREWLVRLRAQYWLDRANGEPAGKRENEYAQAYASADAGRQIMASDNGDEMTATAALLLAQDKEKAEGPSPTSEQKAECVRLYQRTVDLSAPLVARRVAGADGVFLQANHALERDGETRKLFESLVAQSPRDDSALTVLQFVCSEYLFDFPCAFSAAQKDALLHDPKGPGAADAYLNLAEAAILVGNDQQTRDWLDISLQQPNLPPREESLAHLYGLWLDMRQGKSGQFSVDFQSWQTATGHFRETHQALNWVFGGARNALQGSALENQQKVLLSAMMDALEDPSRSLPAWPQ